MGERKINGLDDFVAMINRSPDLTPGHVSFEIKMRGGYMVIAAFLVRNPITWTPWLHYYKTSAS